MLQEFLTRLAIALPLVCAAAVVALLAVKRGWIPWPRTLRTGKRTPAPHAALPDFAVTAIKSLTPAGRVAVVRFHGRDHLVGITGNALVLLATAGTDSSATTTPESPNQPFPNDPPSREPTPWTS